MSLRTWYIILVILFISCSIGFLFFRERILFFLYGYEQNLIKAVTPESFAAYKKIALGKKFFMWLSLVLAIACTAASYHIKRSQLDINPYLVSVIFYVALIVSILLLVGAFLSFFIPTRIV